jgi:NADP-dependent 3-hydroxy acid dehydrogenase YdfG
MLVVRQDAGRVVTVCPGSVATPFLDHQTRFTPQRDRILTAEDVADAVLATLTLPDRAMVSELDIRPSNP